MRDGEPGLVEHLAAVEEKIEIECPRAVLAGNADAPEPALDGEQPVEELARGQSRLELGGSVEIGRLIADSDRLRLAEVETATTSIPSSSPSEPTAARIVSSRSPRFAPRPT